MPPQLKPAGPAPYTAATSAVTAIDAYRERGLGIPVTPEVLVRAGVKESIAARTILSLKQLGLLDDHGRPTELFEELKATRTDEDYRARLQEWLRNVYGDVLQYTNPSEDPPEKVATAFRGYKPEGQRAAMAGLLVGLWRYAGLPVAEGPGSSRPSGSPTPRRITVPRRVERVPAIDTRQPTRSDLPPELVGLLHGIPRDGSGWTRGRRDAFLKLFEVALDYLVPVEGASGESREDDEQEESL